MVTMNILKDTATKYVGVCGARGGVGASVAALGIALALARRGYPCALIDLGGYGHALDAYLGVEDGVVYHLGDCLTGRASPARACLTPRENLYFLPACGRPLSGGEVREALSLVTEALHPRVVVLDCPSGGPLPHLDLMVAVTATDPLSLRATARMTAACGVENVGLLLNGRLGDLNPRLAIDSLEIPLLGILPSCEGEVTEALGEIFDRIATRLEGGHSPLLYTG